VLVAKITTVGNSLGIVLSRETLARLRVEKGDYLYLVESPLGVELMPYDPEFVGQMQEAEKLMRGERNILRVLSDAARESQVGRLPSRGDLK
jgi:putative addiction module antidote